MTRLRTWHWLVLIAGIVSLLAGTHAIMAKEPPVETGRVITIGMNVESAQRVLKHCKIEETQKKYSLSKDTDWLFRRLSRGVDVVFAYSKASHRITEITLFYGYPPYCKGDDVGVSARSIRFEKDGSYIVHCENPKKDTKN